MQYSPKDQMACVATIIQDDYSNIKNDTYLTIVNIDDKCNFTLEVSIKGKYTDPSWSKDGKNIAIIIKKELNDELLIYNTTTKTVNAVCTRKSRKRKPVWDSHNNIYFMQKENDNWEIALLDGKTNEVKTVVSDSIYDCMDPEVLPQINKLVYVLGKEESTLESILSNAPIMLADIKNNTHTMLIQEGINRNPRISPDGTKMIYEHICNVMYTKCFNMSSIEMYAFKEKTIISLTSEGSFYSPCWAKNGKHVYVLCGGNQGRYMRGKALGEIEYNEVGVRFFRISINKKYQTKDDMKKEKRNKSFILSYRDQKKENNKVFMSINREWPNSFDIKY